LIDISLRVLRYFVAAADHGNVTAAARALKVSQPSVSLAIAQLEEAVKTQLFVRQHSRGVALTPAGTTVLREARKLLAHVGDFADGVSGVAEETRGSLAVGCLGYLAPRYLAGLLSGFLAQYPQTDVTFRDGDQPDLIRGMVNGELEVALTYDLMLPRPFAVEPLLDLPPYIGIGWPSAAQSICVRSRTSPAPCSTCRSARIISARSSPRRDSHPTCATAPPRWKPCAAWSATVWPIRS
jgi:DNA-binding transcriptional LysR family regulator